jgi:hypothetical protein
MYCIYNMLIKVTLNVQLIIFLQCEPKHYEQAVQLLWEIMKETLFTKERLQIVAKKSVNNASIARRNGNHVAAELLASYHHTEGKRIYEKRLNRSYTFKNIYIFLIFREQCLS